MFQVTDEELKKAKESMFPTFKDGDQVSFVVTEVEEKDVGTDNAYHILSTKITSGENNGRNFKFFLRRNNDGARMNTLSLLKALFTDDQLKAGLPESAMIGKSFSATARMSTSNGKTYTNWRDYKAVGTMEGHTSQEANIPF